MTVHIILHRQSKQLKFNLPPCHLWFVGASNFAQYIYCKDNVLLFYCRICAVYLLLHSIYKSSYGNYATIAIKIDILSRFSDLSGNRMNCMLSSSPHYQYWVSSPKHATRHILKFPLYIFACNFIMYHVTIWRNSHC